MNKSISHESLLRLFVSRDLGPRDASIDALRGLAIIGMIMVNHRPPTAEVYAFLNHAPLLGWTFADAIFPVFLFLVGVSISYSGINRMGRTASVPYMRILRRAALLILISIALVNFPYYDFETLIIEGTLFRIAICYFAAALISWHCTWRVQLAIAGSVLAVQWWFLTQYEVPGAGPGAFTVEGNASGYLDHLVLGTFAQRFVLNGPVSQGLLPSASAIATTIIGVVAGKWLNAGPESGRRDLQMFVAGSLLLLLGCLWGLSYPVSKPLWTGSYVVLMAGLSLQALALLRWLRRFPKLRFAGIPFQIAGVNALFFYVLAQSIQRVLTYGRVENADGEATRFRELVYEQWTLVWGEGKASTLLYTLVFLAICYLVVIVLYRRRIFIKL